MDRLEALALLKLDGSELTQEKLQAAYWSVAKQVHLENPEALSAVNVAKDLLERELIQAKLPAIVDANALLATFIQSQAIQSRAVTAADKLSKNVQWAFVKLIRRSRTMRDSSIVIGAVGAAASFFLNSLNVTDRLDAWSSASLEGVSRDMLIWMRALAANEMIIHVVLWGVFAYAGAFAFTLNLQIQRVEEMRDDTLRQLSREASWQTMLDNVFHSLSDLDADVFRDKLTSEVLRQLEANKMPRSIRRIAPALALDLEDYLLSIDAVESERVTGGSRMIARK